MARAVLRGATMSLTNLPYALLALAVSSILAACSSGAPTSAAADADASSTTPGALTETLACAGSSSDCIPDQCLCVDGTAQPSATACVQNVCRALNSMCTTVCESHGGLARTRPLPNVIGSAECDAFCAKAEALGCGSVKCDRVFHCSYDVDECAASKRAYLACQVESGTWSCNAKGNGWGVTASGCKAANAAGCNSRDDG